MSEYIGSRISLISKSDIKYIGTLHEINSDSHTVALENVTSYGTEGRKGNPAEEIPGSDQVYEYIVFRGSDVKELTIVAPPSAPKENERPQMPDDPAILGSARPAPQAPQEPSQNQARGQQPPYPPQPQFGFQGPPPNQFPNQPRFQGPGGPHGFPGTPGAVPGYGYGPPPPPGYYGPPPGHGYPPHPPHPPPGHFGGPPLMPPGPPGQHRPPPGPLQQGGSGTPQPPVGSKQSTPQPAGPPTHLPSQPAQPDEKAAPYANAAKTQPPGKPSTPASNAQGQQPAIPKAAQKAGQRVAVPLPPPHVLAAKPPQKPAATTQPAPPTGPSPAQSQPIQDATQAAAAAVAAAMAKLGNPNQTKAQGDGLDNLAQKVNQMKVQDGQQYRGRGRGRTTAPRGPRRDSLQKPVEVPKEDFDFETANAKFNKQDLIKEAIASGSPITSPTNGETADPLASAKPHAPAESSEDIVIPPKAKIEKGYDKKSSFFDDISSDLKDRVEQAQQQETFDGRVLRREERTKNVETFGQGSVDTGYRGGYRGRGRGRGYSRGGFRGRGGYDYRGQGGFRGRGGLEAGSS